ncbi:hypothetical protein QTO34_017992 [Cnephaeus nilssonii]|uniref:Sulfurtransferase n=1 Tax=Cnephaeus nilssonii TaxID=3371016 RepID=A0AA40I304_CNENI|nr:hypothetical protein QTO34_017992 [Eptesicus nilssonii]
MPAPSIGWAWGTPAPPGLSPRHPDATRRSQRVSGGSERRCARGGGPGRAPRAAGHAGPKRVARVPPPVGGGAMVQAGRGVAGPGFEPRTSPAGRGGSQGGGEGDWAEGTEPGLDSGILGGRLAPAAQKPQEGEAQSRNHGSSGALPGAGLHQVAGESVRAGKLGPSLRVLDASWYSPGTRDARQEYLERHVPGASFFDIEECKDKSSPYEMMLPSEAGFADYVGHLGIGNDTHVVVYDGDQLGSFYAPRVWWMFRVFGHRTVSVLNGGFRNWLKEGHPVTSEPSRPEPAVFKATLDRSLLKTYEQVLENLESKRFQLVDSRAQGRYLGTQPEPDAVDEKTEVQKSDTIYPRTGFGPHPRRGQHAVHGLPDGDGFEKSPEMIRAMFEAKKVDLAKPLIATCRKGVTACHIALAAYLCGKPDVAVYDGSWFEWFHRAPPETRVSQSKDGKA